MDENTSCSIPLQSSPTTREFFKKHISDCGSSLQLLPSLDIASRLLHMPMGLHLSLLSTSLTSFAMHQFQHILYYVAKHHLKFLIFEIFHATLPLPEMSFFSCLSSYRTDLPSKFHANATSSMGPSLITPNRDEHSSFCISTTRCKIFQQI